MRVIDTEPAIRPSALPFALVAVCILCGSGAADPADTRDGLVAQATSAMAAALSEHVRFRNFSAFTQYPGTAYVCGEAAGVAANEPAWHAFYASRTTRGWSFQINPGSDDFSDHEACSAAIHENLRQMQSDKAADRAAAKVEGALIDKRCPMESAVFWGDYRMACAGHPVR